MNTVQQRTWNELRPWDFGEPDAAPGYSFVDKLARNTGWPVNHAKRVVEEFRKYVFILACFAEEVLAPSADVDEAWHLALQFTRRYALMCERFLGEFKHHTPSISDENQRQLRLTLDRTLQVYEQLFCQVPPRDIWSSEDRRYPSRQPAPAQDGNCA